MSTSAAGVFVVTAGSVRQPDAPTGVGYATSLSPNPSTTAARVSWTASTVPVGGDPVSSYRIYKDGLALPGVAGSVVEADLVGLLPATDYVIEVSAVNSFGEGAKSAAFTVTTASVIGAPPPPTVLPGSVTTTTAILTWAPVSYAKGAPYYEVFRTSPSSDLVTPLVTTAAGAGTATVTGLTPSTNYSFVVKSVDPTTSTNLSAVSNTVAVKTGTGPTDGVRALSADDVVEAFGINWHIGFNGTYGFNQSEAFAQNAIQLGVVDLGCRYLRDSAPSGNNVHQRNVSTWAIARGVKFLLHCGADRAAMTSQGAADTHVDNHLDAIQWMGASYVNGIAALEGINEPNNDGDSGWALKSTRAQIAWWNRKALRNTAPRLDTKPMLGTSMANRPAGGATQYADDYTALGDQSATGPNGQIADYGVNHIYQGGLNPSNRLATVQGPSRISFPAPMPLWCTEMGYFDSSTTTVNNQYVPDSVQAKYYPVLLMTMINAGFVKAFMYEGLDDVVTSSSSADDQLQGSFGLIGTPSMDQSTWVKKAQWYAMKRFLSLMADPGASFTPDALKVTVTGGGTGFKWKLYQKSDGKFYLLMWRDVKLYQNHSPVTVADVNATVTLPAGMPVTVHRPSFPTTSTALSSTGTSLGSVTTFTLPMNGEIQVAVIG